MRRVVIREWKIVVLQIIRQRSRNSKYCTYVRIGQTHRSGRNALSHQDPIRSRNQTKSEQFLVVNADHPSRPDAAPSRIPRKFGATHALALGRLQQQLAVEGSVRECASPHVKWHPGRVSIATAKPARGTSAVTRPVSCGTRERGSDSGRRRRAPFPSAPGEEPIRSCAKDRYPKGRDPSGAR